MLQKHSSKNITPHLLQDLLAQNSITQKTYCTALPLLPRPLWQNWIQQLLLLLGTSLFLSGVIFFFAYNWADMIPLYKFSVIQGAILLFAGLSHYLGVNKLSGQTCVSGCVILIGVLLAVFGQIYQTGADSYELFMGWSLLTLGLVAYGRFAALWLIWLCISTVAILLYWDQVAHPVYHLSGELLVLILALLYGLALSFFEVGFHKKWSWLQVRWLPPLLLASILTALTIPVFELIFDFNDSERITQITGVTWGLTIGITSWWYRSKHPDFLPLFLTSTTACVVTIAVICKLMFEFVFSANLDEGAFLLTGLIILVCVGLTAMWLKKLHYTLTREARI